MPKETVEQKAERLLVEGDRIKVVGPTVVFHVRGDHAAYIVRGAGDQMGCNCAAKTTCSHILAARKLWQYQRMEE